MFIPIDSHIGTSMAATDGLLFCKYPPSPSFLQSYIDLLDDYKHYRESDTYVKPRAYKCCKVALHSAYTLLVKHINIKFLL